jgi:hypothetical protein
MSFRRCVRVAFVSAAVAIAGGTAAHPTFADSTQPVIHQFEANCLSFTGGKYF